MKDVESERVRRVDAAQSLADAIEEDDGWVLGQLRRVSSEATAEDEIDKTIRALRTYGRELGGLVHRIPYGDVAVAIPFNNPLYSLVLYCVGPAVGGSKVTVRPSSITAETVYSLFDRYAARLVAMGIELYTGSGSNFLKYATGHSDTRTLLFTGSYENLQSLAEKYPSDKGLIYCGSGVNPFIVTPDGFSSESQREDVIDLAIRSRLYNSGQDCLCAERFYIHDDVFDNFRTRLIDRLARIRCGGFEDELSVITPLLGPLADYTRNMWTTDDHVITAWGRNPEGSLVHPRVYELDLSSSLMMREKFAPIFTLARYSTIADLDRVLDIPYRFGATICGDYSSQVLDTYPHITRSCSVIEDESEDAHVPYGGRLRSGFSARDELKHDGPILFSNETTYLEDA